MNLIQRVQDILLKPKATWPVIDAEADDLPSLYKNYLMILALIPALAGFIGLSLVGVSAFGVSYRVPIVSGLVTMVVGYVLTLVMVFVVSLLVDALAPTFGGTKNPTSALKVMVYGSTAGLVGGIFSLLPMLSILGMLTGLYSIYLIYTGLPVLMKCPEGKAAGYTAAVVVLSILAWIVVAGAMSLLTPSPARMGAEVSGAPAVAIVAPDDATRSTRS